MGITSIKVMVDLDFHKNSYSSVQSNRLIIAGSK